MSELSVVTLVGADDEPLHDLVASLYAQTRRPDELVVAHLEPRPPRVRHGAIPVRVVHVAGVPPRRALARNEAALLARGPALVFIDPSCQPTPTAIAAFCAALEAADAVFLGDVLDPPAGRRSPAPTPAASRPSIVTSRCDYADFDAASFAIRRATYGRLGGMDPRFAGFGGDAEDFAASLELHGVPLFRLAAACAFRRRAAPLDPLRHFDDIIRNAWTYYRKWGQWPMREWLDQFAAAGYVSLDADDLKVHRTPTPEELRATHRSIRTRGPR
ncbi:MAG: hypothetical protein R3A79_07450 [Nannocystaceae bacterium]